MNNRWTFYRILVLSIACFLLLGCEKKYGDMSFEDVEKIISTGCPLDASVEDVKCFMANNSIEYYEYVDNLGVTKINILIKKEKFIDLITTDYFFHLTFDENNQLQELKSKEVHTGL